VQRVLFFRRGHADGQAVEKIGARVECLGEEALARRGSDVAGRTTLILRQVADYRRTPAAAVGKSRLRPRYESE
jgi:hypothetical protein